jgi:hypothetical protein
VIEITGDQLYWNSWVHCDPKIAALK